MSSPDTVRPPRRPVCQLDRATRTVPSRSEISRLNATSLDPPKTTRLFVRPIMVRASTSPKIVDSWAGSGPPR